MPPARDPIVIVSAADDNYALPLGVTIRSVIDRLPPDRQLSVNILNGGLSPRSKQRLSTSWKDPRVTIAWHEPPIDRIADLKTEGHLNYVTYLRLFMPSILPETLQRVIFLDADLLICRDISELWDMELEDAPVAAVPDYYTPHLNTRETIGRPSFCDRFPDKSLPIKNYRELGLKGSAGYFNAGVMVINLKKWRQMDVLHQALRLLRQHHEHVLYCDQYALNVLFSEKWKPLDVRWNQNLGIWCWLDSDELALDSAQAAMARSQPYIVHFTWIHKPWHHGCTHPATRQFFRVVDRTDWRGWRPLPPARPPRPLKERVGGAYKQYRTWYRQNISPSVRSLKVALGLKKRAA
jgi:lipopolysaccharide biosynthesis glycosyltransferase